MESLSDEGARAGGRRRLVWLVPVVALFALLAYFVSLKTGLVGVDHAGHEAAATSKGHPGSFFLRASDQETDGKKIVIDKVILRGSGGYVAVHSQHGEPWPLIGASKLLPKGESSNVVVWLTQPLNGDATVFPMLHLEENGNSSFDFPDSDLAAEIDDALIVFPIDVKVKH